jgi:invasion protein IalB
MQSYGLRPRITGYWQDVAFSREIGLNSPFGTRRGLTPGTPDVGTELLLVGDLIRRWIRSPWRKISLYGAVICRISRVAANFAKEIAEEIKGSTLMGPSKYPSSFRPRRICAPNLRSISVMAAGLVVLCWLGLTTPSRAQGAVRSVHGDWQIRCDTPPGAQGEQCALIQSVVAEDRSNAGLTVIVLKTADQKSKLMRVVAPLGVLLPSGLGLKLDNVDVGRAGFVRCLPNGCVAEVVMDDKLLGQLRSAKTATFIIFETPEEGIGFPLSLNGLGEGYDKLP